MKTKTNTKAARPVHSRSYLRHKLVSAAALLLVSSIMLVSTSYAWYVLSTAPEVSNIKTQVGANGALEIALLNADSVNDLSLLDMGDIDESLTPDDPVAATVANLTWGNLVNLDDASYGLDKITLSPSRLYIEQDGSDVSGIHKVNTVPLKVPVYGEDGRVKSLDKTSAVAYSYANGSFSNAGGYGVRAIGTSATMSVFQLGMNAARSSLVTYSSAARTAASNALQSTGGALANVVVAYAVSDQTDGFTNADVAKVKELAEGMQGSLGEIETALRYAFAGYITTTNAAADGVTSENYQTKLAEITNTGEGKKTLAELMTMYPGITAVIPEINTVYIAKLTANQTAVTNASAACGNLTDDNHTWTEITGIITPLMNTSAMLVNGKTIETLKSELIVNGDIDFQKALNLVSGGITITVPSGSGILSDIADFAGDYTATVPVTVNTVLSGQELNASVDVLMTTATTVSSVYLTAAGNGLKAATVADAVGSNSITDYYGYAIDLAFRTNAEESNLLLQTEPENRIYEGDNRNAALQGAGSYMSFTTTAGLSATKMVKLMSGIRVVLMDGSQEILAIAALDTTLGKDVYEAETVNGTATGMYYLDGSAGAYQNSDLIDAAAYNALPDTSKVTFNKTTGKVTAKLYLYNYEMTKSTTTDASGNVVDRVVDGKVQYTGGLTIGSKIESGVITALSADVPQKVTALVYLDGSVVNNATVAANSAQSMAGVLNLQFSSSATLVPAEITKLQTEGSAVEYTALSGGMFADGYLHYDDTIGLCKIKDGYTFYEGSDGKFYFATADSGYTELTVESYSTALTPVTATLTASAATVAKDGTVTLTPSVSNNDLTITECLLTRTAGTDEIATHTVSGTVATVTGVGAGEVSYQATVKVQIASGGIYRVPTNTVTVTVTE